ncbi:MAG: hypothetical protein C0418_03815 [Coriobacteriaceae bacterium]|nr:hypothetical protein [Coriobacteriaceae bacterium]
MYARLSRTGAGDDDTPESPMDATHRLIEAEAVSRLKAHDVTLYTTAYDERQSVMQRLGWTDLAEKAPERFALLDNLRNQLVSEDVTDLVLLGIGGSSLAPLVLASVLPLPEDAPRLHVLDTTCPSTVDALMDSLRPETTWFVLASKSGTTIEPLSLYAIFRAWADHALGRKNAGRRFLVITDPGTPLDKQRQHDLMRLALSGVPTVGGRFSALTMFGLAPAALLGANVPALVERARGMEIACGLPALENPAAELAAWMHDSYERSADKLTVACSAPLASFGLWVEQLVAESTGKGGVGVVPVLEDARPESYGPDRAVVVVRLRDDTELAEWAARMKRSHPCFEIVLDDPYDIGAEFVRWENAVALLGFLLGINPFDEPDVAAAKSATEQILKGLRQAPPAVADLEGVWVTPAGALLADWPAPDTLAGALRYALDSLYEPDYLAVLTFLPEDEALLAPLRDAVRTLSLARGNAACFEIGPRYLHSTGQLHKGGPDTGVFLIVTARDHTDVPVPGERHTLQMLYRAQAEGDLATLGERGRRVMRLDLPAGSPEAVAAFADALRTASA